MAGFTAILLLLQCLLFSQPSYSLPLCTDFRAPTKIKTPLGFFPYDGTTCCDSTKDLQLQKQFQRMNISDTTCASLVKSILMLVVWHCQVWFLQLLVRFLL
ncbi:HIPL1 protein-like [Beta vulgaris subsp. vulgaris]|uniref:HIPL1 protein-like n=1 Tax=Beta vulgaris subsp. vulgaris TaxID=3555 RepID=UPI0020366BE9|nr:HIPL1 protein-like [Beta vulgaris subsp. vulgaris]